MADKPKDDIEVVEGAPIVPEPDRHMLTPGAFARIYRDGHVLEGGVNVPMSGPLELRHLAPGSYVLKDELDGFEEIEVHPKDETTVVRVKGSAVKEDLEGGTAEPGSSYVIPAPEPEKQPEMKFPPRPKQIKPEAPAEEDIPVKGEPGSALIEEMTDKQIKADEENERRRNGLTVEVENADDPSKETKVTAKKEK